MTVALLLGLVFGAAGSTYIFWELLRDYRRRALNAEDRADEYRVKYFASRVRGVWEERP